MSTNLLLNISYIKNLLRENRLVLSKKRGQHFLIDSNILRKIVETADLGPEDEVLEIGAGLGTLTLELCKKAGKVVAVEWDRGLVKLLLEITAACKNLEVIQADILGIDFVWLKRLFKHTQATRGKLKVVSNLPYSISSPVLVKLLESRIGIEAMVCMVQEEVGERIVSSPGKKNYGILSILAQMYGSPRIVFRVARGCFFPSPRVDSVIIHFQIMSGGAHPVKDRRLWKTVVKAAFSQRRKMLKNTLAQDNRLGYTADEVREACIRAQIDPNLRAEKLSVEDFVHLADALYTIRMTD